MKLSSYGIKHPAIITIVLIALILFSFISFRTLSSQFLPDIKQPQAFIITKYPGVSAIRIDKEISTVLQNALVTIPGINEMSTESRESVSVIVLKFGESENVDLLLPIIRERINTVSDSLPGDILGVPEIHVSSVATYLPILTFSVKSEIDPVQLTNYCDDTLLPSLYSVKGISKVEVLGGVYEEIEIKLDLNKLNRKGISIIDVYELLKRSNISIPSGKESYQNQNINIRTTGEFQTIQEIENLKLSFKDGAFIYLRDVGSVTRKISESELIVTSSSKRVPFIEVYRREGADTLDIINSSLKIINTLEKASQGSIDFEIVKNDSHITRTSIKAVINSALLGTLLAILVIFIFLHNLRATIIIGISIPLSILISFIGFYFTGITLNMLSLAGITVALGMLVDPSIVVLEHINKKVREGSSSRDASITGASEVSSAVVASATTSIAVFAPLLFLTGIVGIFMGAISKTMIFVLSSSVFVAIIVIPFLTSKYLAKRESKGILDRISKKFGKLISKLDILYRGVLEKSLGHSRYIIVIALLIFGVSIVSLGLTGSTFIPSVDTGEFEIDIDYPDGYGIGNSVEKSKVIEEKVLEVVPNIKSSLFISRESGAMGYISLVDKSERERSIFETIYELQTVLSSEIVGANIKVRNAGMDAILALATGGQGFIIEVTGSDLDNITNATNQINRIVGLDKSVISTEVSLKKSRKELLTKLDHKKLLSLGVTPYEIGLTNRIIFNGETVGNYSKDDIDIKLVSNLHGNNINRETLRSLNYVTRDGRSINYPQFSSVEIEQTLDSIETKNRLYSAKIVALTNTSETGGISSRISNSLNSITFPAGVHWSIGGSAGLWNDSLKSLLLVLIVSVFLVYAVMVIQFERFVQPLIVMSSIPFCLIGVNLGLKLFGSNMSIIAFLALISLGGIVVNNAIVLIDYINLIRRRDGITLREAIIEGGSSRIQPILMTTLTTMFGVIPMALGRGEGSSMYAPLGQAIFGGMISSTIITLILIPVLYYRFEERRGIRKLRESKHGKK